MRTVVIAPEAAVTLRCLLREAQEAYLAYERKLKEIRNRCQELVGPVDSEEIAALCKDTNAIEVVTHAEYLDDLNKVRWH
jgi:hypothetical protein